MFPEKKIMIESKHLIHNKEIICQHCGVKFTRKDNLTKHINKGRCKKLKNKRPNGNTNMDDDAYKNHTICDLEKKVEILVEEITKLKDGQIPVSLENRLCDLEQKPISFEHRISSLEQRPSVINNNLQIICVGQNDNYLDMLTQQWGFDKAIEYIKDCALCSLTGDCKLIEKIYIENHPDSINYIDKKKTQIQYFDENKNKIIDNKVQFGKKVANNLQNSYLKGINHLINENLNNRRCPNKFLEDYDIQAWNQHIFDLSDIGYQKKIVNNLNITQLQ